MKKDHIIPLVGILVSLATLIIIYYQFKSQKELQDIQKEVAKIDLRNKQEKI